MTINKLVLIGPPGCGKGTQAESLRDHFKLTHISSGNVLRDEVKRGTNFGTKIKKFMDRGEIGPVELITEVILNHVDETCPDSFLFDGFPRALYQAKELKKRHNLDAAILIKVPESSIIERISGRRTCSECGNVFHITANPPAREGICDSCDNPLIQREDDNEATVSRRMEVYKTQTAPVIEFYKKEGMLKEVKGDGTPEEVFAQILNIL